MTSPRSISRSRNEVTHESALAQSSGVRNSKANKPIIAATIGCMLEWYDFAVYGYFAVVISHLFFPSNTESVSLLLSVATFGVGFVMRPIGAIFFGTLSDRKGRRVAMSWTVVTMVIGTAIITFSPTYASIGIAAPLLIVVARLIQGFSAGGEMGSALSYLVEYAPKKRRYLFASFQQVTQILALLLGSIIAAAVNSWLSPADVEAWGWRLPFALGLLIAPVGWYIRKKTEEPPVFAEVLARRKRAEEDGTIKVPSVWSTLSQHPRETLGGFCITILWTVCTYFFLIFMPTYSVTQLHLPASESLLSNGFCLLVAAIGIPVFAWVADRTGAALLLRVASLLVLCGVYPALMILSYYPSVQTLVAFQVTFALIIAAFTAPAGGALARLFPDESRSTGVSIAYNFAVTVFGGFASFIATWLVTTTGNKLSPAYYVMFAASAALLGVSLISRRLRKGAG